jgi:AraC family transcriptional activator of tynA and feaB
MRDVPFRRGDHPGGVTITQRVPSGATASPNAVLGNAAAKVLLDTDTLPAPDRADALQDSFRNEPPQRVVFGDISTARHRAEMIEFGPDVRIRRNFGTPITVIRTERHVRAEAPEYVCFGLQRQGDSRLTVGGSTRAASYQHLDCVDGTRPYALEQLNLNQRDDLIISNQQVGVSVDVVRAAAPSIASSPVYELLRGHVASLFGASAKLAPQPLLLAGQATTALVRALLLTAAEHRLAQEALEDTLVYRVQAFIEAHLSDRELRVERIAAAHHISARHLYNVWARAGRDETLNQWIIHRRLVLAREQLGSTDPAQTSIESIARKCGFGDVSHFNRRFRQAFSMSPSEWRARLGELPH